MSFILVLSPQSQTIVLNPICINDNIYFMLIKTRYKPLKKNYEQEVQVFHNFHKKKTIQFIVHQIPYRKSLDESSVERAVDPQATLPTVMCPRMNLKIRVVE